MKRKTLPALIAALVLAFCLAGCSQAQNMTEDTLKGVWSLEKGSSTGFDAYISFEDDSIVEMIIADSWLDGTWKVQGTSGTVTFNSMYFDEEETSSSSSASGSSSSSSSDSATGKLTYANNKLVLGSDNGTKLVFVKDDSDTAKRMFALDVDGADGADMVDDTEYVEEAISDIGPVTIADDDKINITVTGKGTDFTADPCYRLTITNKTDKAVYLIPSAPFKVGDKTVEAGFGDEVDAGQTIETEMYFAKDELGGGLELLTTVDGPIQVLDDTTDAEIATYQFHME